MYRYLNGAFIGHHEDGYTSFNVYLHNASAGTKYGKGNRNVLAVYVDATESELWCYEGGGIYRHVWLESASMTHSDVINSPPNHFVYRSLEDTDGVHRLSFHRCPLGVGSKLHLPLYADVLTFR